MKISKQNKQGISLIVLVITIIVMIILAAAVVLTLSNSGIISKTNEAVDATDLANVQDMATMLWADEYIESEGKATKDELYDAVITGLKASKVDTTKYNINVTLSGVTVTKVGEGWVQTGTTVTKGGVTLEVGNYIDYKANVDGYTDTNGWRILGAEDGELLIVSANNVVDEFQLGGTDLETSKSAFETAIDDLDEECEKYGHGDKATGVRSITGEDVDRVAQYDKTTFTGLEYLELLYKLEGGDVSTITAEERAMFEILDYGREITFSWNGTTNPVYSYLKSGETEPTTGSLSNSHNTFTWYDFEAKAWRTSTKAESGSIVDNTDTTKVAKITNDGAFYLGSDKIAADSAAYEMLIATKAEDGTEIPLTYWLASPYVGVDPDCAGFGVRAVDDGFVVGDAFVLSGGGYCGGAFGVRAVVSLESDIQLEPATETSWTIAN